VTETTKLTTFLPGFGGFHGTRWENLFPFSLDRCAERFARYEGADELTAADLDAILRETSEASRFFAALATRYCRRFDADISRWLGFKLGLTFSEFDIPAAAGGGTTDFILATMPVGSAGKLLERSAKEGHQRLLGSIRDRFGRTLTHDTTLRASGPISQPNAIVWSLAAIDDIGGVIGRQFPITLAGTIVDCAERAH
jgi:hypothetical protein